MERSLEETRRSYDYLKRKPTNWLDREVKGQVEEESSKDFAWATSFWKRFKEDEEAMDASPTSPSDSEERGCAVIEGQVSPVYSPEYTESEYSEYVVEKKKRKYTYKIKCNEIKMKILNLKNELGALKKAHYKIK